MMRSLSRAAMLLAVALFLGVCVASASTSEVAAYGPISCIETPFGRRMTLGFEQEYALVHAGAAGSLVGVQSVVHDSGNFTQAGNSSILASFATAASIETTHIDLDGDGKDEWAVAGIKTGDAHTVVVTTFQRDPNQPGTVLQGPVWEWNNASNILDVKIATADLVGRKYDSRQELVVAIRDATQTVRVLVLTDRIGRLLAIDTIGRAGIVAEPRERGLDVEDEVRSAWRRRRRAIVLAVVIGARIGVGFRCAGNEANAGANGSTGACAPAATDDAADDGADHAALHAALDDLRLRSAHRPRAQDGKGKRQG